MSVRSAEAAHRNAPTALNILALNPNKIGTVEEYMVALSRSLRTAGWQSVIVLEAPPIEPLMVQFRDAGADLEYMSPAKRNCGTWKLIRKYRAQVVHFHFYEQFSWLPLIARLGGAQVVIFTEHIRQPNQFAVLKRMHLKLCNLLLRQLGCKVLAISDYIRSLLVNNYEMHPEQVSILRNGVSLSRFRTSPDSGREVRRELGLSPENSLVLSASNLRPEKGLDVLLKAFPIILKKCPSAVLIIVGDGPEKNRLEELAAELRLGERVRFLGLRSDVQLFMQICDVLVVPSVWQEPAGLVVLEAMACGKPVVVTRVGGMPEPVLNGSTGMIVPPNSGVDLAEAISSILGDHQRALNMGAAARQHAETEYSMDRWVALTLREYGITP
jgi:glycosyltransferase involved in cell wall biosynthesis